MARTAAKAVVTSGDGISNVFQEAFLYKLVTIVAVVAVVVMVFLASRRWIALMVRRRHFQQSLKICPPLTVPSLPREYDRTSQVLSQRIRGRGYRVNLYRLTCSCVRYRRFRGLYPEGDLRRMCRHIRRNLQETGALQHYSELIRRIIQDRVRDRCYKEMKLMGTEMVVGYHPRLDAVRVFTRRMQEGDPVAGPFTGPYDKFVYNSRQEVWIYGEAPPGAEVIISEVMKLLVQRRPQVMDERQTIE